MIAGTIALVAASLFAGGALHVTLSEHPARLSLAEAPKLLEWQGSFARAQRMAPLLALPGIFFGLFAWWQTRDGLWLVGSLLVGINVPYTLLLIGPTNRRLAAMDVSEAGPVSDGLVTRWGRLHDIRTALAIAAIASAVRIS